MNTRECIIDILGKEWPLTAKGVHRLIRKEYGKQVSYHTVYEILQDLTSKKVLGKHERSYLLDRQWIDATAERYARIRESYRRNQPIRILSHDSSQVRVDSIAALYGFILQNIQRGFFCAEGAPFHMLCNHLWGSFYSEQDAEILRSAFRKGAFIASSGDTPLDHAIAAFYTGLGARVAFGAERQQPDIIVIGDCVIEIYFSERLSDELETVFSSKRVKNLPAIRRFKEIIESPAAIEIVIIRNKNVAERRKQQIVPLTR